MIERGVQFAGLTHRNAQHLDPEKPGRLAQGPEHGLWRRSGNEEKGDPRGSRHRLFQQLKPLSIQLGHREGHTGYISTRLREALHDTGPEEVTRDPNDNGDRRCGLRGCPDGRRRVRVENCRLESNKVSRHLEHAIGLPVAITYLEVSGRTLDPSKLLERL